MPRPVRRPGFAAVLICALAPRERDTPAAEDRIAPSLSFSQYGSGPEPYRALGGM
jgi:hypothetical protein